MQLPQFNHYYSYCVNCYSFHPIFFFLLGRNRFFSCRLVALRVAGALFFGALLLILPKHRELHLAVIVCNHGSKQWSFGETKRFVAPARKLNHPIFLTDKLAQALTPRSPSATMSTRTTEEVYKLISEGVVQYLLYFSAGVFQITVKLPHEPYKIQVMVQYLVLCGRRSSSDPALLLGIEPRASTGCSSVHRRAPQHFPVHLLPP